MKMRVSVVIATYNRRYTLSQTLSTVLHQDIPAADYEVIVVDDGSADGTYEWLVEQSREYRNLQVFWRPHLGQAAAINFGVAAAQGATILFLDDDVICCRELVKQHVEAHAADNTAIVYGPVLLSESLKRCLSRGFAREYHDYFFENLTSDKEADGWWACVGNANTSVSREALQLVGGLDETFSRGNDVELGIRLRGLGIRFVYASRAVVRHNFVKTPRELIREAREEGRADVRLSRKHPGWRDESGISALAASRRGRMMLRLTPLIRFEHERVLQSVASAADVAYRLRLAPRMCLVLLHLCRTFAFCRGTIDAAASWQSSPSPMFHGSPAAAECTVP